MDTTSVCLQEKLYVPMMDLKNSSCRPFFKSRRKNHLATEQKSTRTVVPLIAHRTPAKAASGAGSKVPRALLREASKSTCRY